LALLGSDWRLKLAYCWSHQRRGFVSLGEGCPRWASWAGQWIERINWLFALNGQRRQAWFQKQAQPLPALEAAVRRQVQEMKEAWERELAGACFTLLATLRQHQICRRRYLQAYLEACAH
jgi:hypothetical protein